MTPVRTISGLTLLVWIFAVCCTAQTHKNTRFSGTAQTLSAPDQEQLTTLELYAHEAELHAVKAQRSVHASLNEIRISEEKAHAAHFFMESASEELKKAEETLSAAEAAKAKNDAADALSKAENAQKLSNAARDNAQKALQAAEEAAGAIPKARNAIKDTQTPITAVNHIAQDAERESKNPGSTSRTQSGADGGRQSGGTRVAVGSMLEVKNSIMAQACGASVRTGRAMKTNHIESATLSNDVAIAQRNQGALQRVRRATQTANDVEDVAFKAHKSLLTAEKNAKDAVSAAKSTVQKANELSGRVSAILVALGQDVVVPVAEKDAGAGAKAASSGPVGDTDKQSAEKSESASSHDKGSGGALPTSAVRDAKSSAVDATSLKEAVTSVDGTLASFSSSLIQTMIAVMTVAFVFVC